MSYTVGCVPYLNAKPLVRRFVDLGEASPVRVEYVVPSQLPALLANGSVQAIMVSSIESLRMPGARVAAGVSISTQRDVQSVRLFSKVPPEEIRTVAWDLSSMTSNALAKLVLSEEYGVMPTGEGRPPVQEAMLGEFDACVLIGDNGMRGSGDGLYVLDLGREWNAMTGLPFVWALWVGNETLDAGLVRELQEAERYGQRHFEEVVRHSVEETGFTYEQCEHYFGQIMDYRLTSRHLAGLAEFGRRLTSAGILESFQMPAVVEAD